MFQIKKEKNIDWATSFLLISIFSFEMGKSGSVEDGQRGKKRDGLISQPTLGKISREKK